MDPTRAAPAHDAPATFRERGVAVPFTAPGLLGARVRTSAHGGTVGNGAALELVFPNPSGARGIYVVPWAGVADACAPTLHDLNVMAALARLAGEGPVTPAEVQAIARAAALDGAAGRQARAAAAAAMEADRVRAAAALEHLLPTMAAAGLDARPGRPGAREGSALARIAAEWGVGGDPAAAPLPCAIAALTRLREGLLAWAAAHPDDSGVAELTATLAGGAARSAAAALLAVRQGSEAALVQAWRSAPERLAALAARPSWLLDGWSAPCLIWAAAAPATDPDGGAGARLGTGAATASGAALAGSTAALLDTAALAPALPTEAEGWTGLPTDPSLPWLLRRALASRAVEARRRSPGGVRGRGAASGATVAGALQAGEARASRVQDTIARNERLRALAA